MKTTEALRQIYNEFALKSELEDPKVPLDQPFFCPVNSENGSRSNGCWVLIRPIKTLETTSNIKESESVILTVYNPKNPSNFGTEDEKHGEILFQFKSSDWLHGYQELKFWTGALMKEGNQVYASANSKVTDPWVPLFMAMINRARELVA